MKSDGDSKEPPVNRANAIFKNEEHETTAQAVAAKTERLRALRLAKEAAELAEAAKRENTPSR